MTSSGGSPTSERGTARRLDERLWSWGDDSSRITSVLPAEVPYTTTACGQSKPGPSSALITSERVGTSADASATTTSIRGPFSRCPACRSLVSCHSAAMSGGSVEGCESGHMATSPTGTHSAAMSGGSVEAVRGEYATSVERRDCNPERIEATIARQRSGLCAATAREEHAPGRSPHDRDVRRMVRPL